MASATAEFRLNRKAGKIAKEVKRSFFFPHFPIFLFNGWKSPRFACIFGYCGWKPIQGEELERLRVPASPVSSAVKRLGLG